MHTDTMAPVVVGVDGTTENLQGPLELAAEEAAARVVPLLVVYAHRATDPRRLVDEHELLTTAIADALADHPGLAVSARLAQGDPAQVLIGRSGEASLVVVGHGHRTLAVPAAPTPSVAAAVAAGAGCPVIVHRAVGPTPVEGQRRAVLVGIADGSGPPAVVEFAFEEAALRGAPLRAMHTGSGLDGWGVLDEALTGWSAKYPDVSVVRCVRPGPDAASWLVRASGRAQLLVVGGGRHAPGSIGRTVTAAIDHAGCPVAVVPPGRS